MQHGNNQRRDTGNQLVNGIETSSQRDAGYVFKTAGKSERRIIHWNMWRVGRRDEINLSVRSINFEYHGRDSSGNINCTLLVGQYGARYRRGERGRRRREKERERECLLISQRGTEVLSSYNRKLNAHRCVYNTAFYDLATMVYRPDSKRASSPLCPEKALKRTLEKYQGSISRHKIIRLL